MEGFVVARVVVEALKKAPESATPEAITSALRNLKLDLGGYSVDFAGSRNGSKWVESTIIGSGGRISR
jgi:hypothetical protein